MNPSLFKSIGFLGLFFGISGFLAACLSLWLTWKDRAFRKTFFLGTKGNDLESVILLLAQQLKTLEAENLATSQVVKNLEHALGFAVQKVGVVRYSPFADGGGNYSFSIALLNAHDTGIVITNMYGRQQSRVYTKKLDQGKSETPLTEEEVKAINIANNNQNQRLDN